MHEVSLAGGILKVVEDAARREHFARIAVLRLEAGRLAGVETRALRFALEAIAPGTCLDGARIDIDEPDGRAWCLQCGDNVSIQAHGDACPCCGSYWLQPNGGNELKVIEMLVED